MSPDDLIATIERLRAMGARRVRVGDVEVDFHDAPAAAAKEPPQRVSPEETARQRREADEMLMYAASG